MTSFPHADSEKRSPRLRMAEVTPIVLRRPGGQRTTGKLQCVSLTGGLVVPDSLLPVGSLVNLIFVTSKGPIMGTAEMLHPVSWKEQPFRFAAIPDSHKDRLQALIQPAARQMPRTEI